MHSEEGSSSIMRAALCLTQLNKSQLLTWPPFSRHFHASSSPPARHSPAHESFTPGIPEQTREHLGRASCETTVRTEPVVFLVF